MADERYDRGGFLPHGWTVLNSTDKPIRVLTPDDLDAWPDDLNA